ncbi:MAG: peptidoglycan-N-acetylmuramate O-acetyltransferase, partial [Frankiales bacterium]|nr:peptidoglycan-N-acetylmuramate O-acetyltransferase [Frankiales bacterium]
MPQETAARARLPHIPALNGLRGLAVAAVLLFHADVPGVPGGQFGVTVFFTLSG